MRFVFAVPLALAAGCALAPAAALAAEPEDDAARMAEHLSDPALQDSLAGAAEAMTEAMLAMNVAPLMRAAAEISGEDSAYVDPDTRIGDLAGPEAADVPREMAREVPRMMGAMATLAAALGQMMPELRQAGRRIEDALPRDDYRRY